MDKNLAQKLTRILDKPSILVIEEYIQDRLKTLHTLLENAQDMTSVARIQGQIEELKTLPKIREWAIGVIENG